MQDADALVPILFADANKLVGAALNQVAIMTPSSRQTERKRSHRPASRQITQFSNSSGVFRRSTAGSLVRQWHFVRHAACFQCSGKSRLTARRHQGTKHTNRE
jgi:hypothetical protein